MNSDDYEALKEVVDMADRYIAQNVSTSMPLTEQKAAVATIKDGILSYLKTCDDLISGKLDIQYADGE